MQTVIDAAPMQSAAQSAATKKSSSRQSYEWIGIWGIITWLWVGKRTPVPSGVKHVDHVKWLRVLVRSLSFPLMFFLSIGALVTMTRTVMTSVGNHLTSGNMTPDDVVSAAVVIGVGLLIFVMDGVMIILLVDAGTYKDEYKKVPWGSYLLVGFFMVTESVTYFILLANLEHPKELGDFLLIGLRAVAMPIVAIVAATIKNSKVTDREIDDEEDRKVNLAISETLDLVQAEPKIENLGILLAFKRHIRKTEDAATIKRDEDLVKHVNKFLPTSYNEEIARAKEEADRRVREMEEQIERIETAAHERARQDKEDIMHNILPWLLQIMEQQIWPEELLVHAPHFARIDPIKILKSAGIRTGKPTNRLIDLVDTAMKPEEIYRQVFGKDPPKKGKSPDGKEITLQGVWVTTSQVSAMVGGTIDTDTLKNIVTSIGGSVKIGPPFAAKLLRIVGNTVIQSALIDPWKSWVLARASEQNDDDLIATTQDSALAGGDQ